MKSRSLFFSDMVIGVHWAVSAPASKYARVIGVPQKEARSTHPRRFSSGHQG